MQRRLDIKTDGILELLREGKRMKEIMERYNCGKKCILSRLKNQPIIRFCPRCGQGFITGSNHLKIYCSTNCRDRDSTKNWNEKHPLRSEVSRIQKRIKQRKRLIQKLGDKCVQCGETDWRLLQINHINGNGRNERERIGQRGIRNNILQDKKLNKYNLLCANCNVLYEYEEGRRLDERWIEKCKAKILEVKE
jgi:ribosomal protein S27AE